MTSKSEKVALAVGVVVGGAIPVLAGWGSAEATEPEDVIGPNLWPEHGQAAMHHSQGHDGKGPYDFPVRIGGADFPEGVLQPHGRAGYNACWDQENRWDVIQDTIDAMYKSTVGKPQLPDWPDGLQMEDVGCDVSMNSAGFLATWVDRADIDEGRPGGRVSRQQATSSQCASSQMSHPCGDWSVTVDISKSRWSPRTHENNVRFMLHEFGHGWGLADTCCEEASYSHNGLGNCTWPSEIGYQVIDRKGMFLYYGE